MQQDAALKGKNVYKCLLLVPVLSQMNLVQTTSSCFSKTYLNIILPPTSGSS
jgi:hypothetical protein